jgi:hypothetical protein
MVPSIRIVLKATVAKITKIIPTNNNREDAFMEVLNRVARWYIFIQKFLIWAIFSSALEVYIFVYV